MTLMPILNKHAKLISRLGLLTKAGDRRLEPVTDLCLPKHIANPAYRLNEAFFALVFNFEP